MSGEKNISLLVKGMTPELNAGEYVFVTTNNLNTIPLQEIVGMFKESEGITIILAREKADTLELSYDYIASWITLKIHSSLEAVGLTAAFSSELAKHDISCNVIAGYYHDHIFVHKDDGERAITILQELSQR